MSSEAPPLLGFLRMGLSSKTEQYIYKMLAEMPEALNLLNDLKALRWQRNGQARRDFVFEHREFFSKALTEEEVIEYLDHPVTLHPTQELQREAQDYIKRWAIASARAHC